MGTSQEGGLTRALHWTPGRRSVSISKLLGRAPVRAIVRTMNARLIELLLSSPSGNAVREGLQLNEEQVFTEVLHVNFRPAPDRRSTCEDRAMIARVAEDSTLAGDAVEVDFQCLGAVALGFAHDDQQTEFEDLEPNLDIDVGARFRILCQDFAVKNVRAF